MQGYKCEPEKAQESKMYLTHAQKMERELKRQEQLLKQRRVTRLFDRLALNNKAECEQVDPELGSEALRTYCLDY